MTHVRHSDALSRCIIHIGMHKTGTTSIQGSLDGFADQQFLYPRLGTTSNHSLPIYSLFATRPEGHYLHKVAGRDRDAVQKYINEVRQMLDVCASAAAGRTLLISGEDIAGLTERDLIKLRNYFQRRFDQLMIVAYVRPPAGFMTSSFQERIKNGGMKTFRPRRMYRNYRVSFGKFDRVFGKETVRLWKFDPNKFPDRDVVQHFCASLAIPLPKKKIVRANEALSRRAVAALYTYNKFGNYPGRNVLPALGEKICQRLFKGEAFRLAPDLVQPVLAKRHEDIEWMEARLAQSLAEDIGPHKAADVICENDLLRPDPELVARLMAELGNGAPPRIKGETPAEVAELIERVCIRNNPSFAAIEPQTRSSRTLNHRHSSRQKNVIDVFERRNPRRLNGISPTSAKHLAVSAFHHICSRLDQTSEGRISFDRFGTFHIVKAKKKTEEPQRSRSRIRYEPVTRSPQRNAVLHSEDVIREMHERNPGLLHGIKPNEARELLNNVFDRINRRLARLERGVVTCEGLGRFRVNGKRHKAKGPRTSRGQIIFRPQGAAFRQPQGDI